MTHTEVGLPLSHRLIVLQLSRQDVGTSVKSKARHYFFVIVLFCSHFYLFDNFLACFCVCVCGGGGGGGGGGGCFVLFEFFGFVFALFCFSVGFFFCVCVFVVFVVFRSLTCFFSNKNRNSHFLDMFTFVKSFNEDISSWQYAF